MRIVAITARTEPMVLDLTREDVAYEVAVEDPSLDLATFVVGTPEGEVNLEDLVEEAKKRVSHLMWTPARITIGTAMRTADWPVCVQLRSVQVCG